MVQFGVSAVDEAMNLGREAAEYISGTFIKVILQNTFSMHFNFLYVWGPYKVFHENDQILSLDLIDFL